MSIVGVWSWERVSGFKASSLRVILLGLTRAWAGRYKRLRISMEKNHEKIYWDGRIDCLFPRS